MPGGVSDAQTMFMRLYKADDKRRLNLARTWLNLAAAKAHSEAFREAARNLRIVT